MKPKPSSPRKRRTCVRLLLYPEEKAQALHFDDAFYPFPRPRRSVSISVIGAIDAFTPENGGTVLYGGSHK